MCRPSFLAWTPLLLTAAAFAQTAPPEPQPTQALLAEIRLLRQDLQNVAATIQRVQIVMYRLQAETASLDRVTERFENDRNACAQAQEQRKFSALQLEQTEARRRAAANAPEQAAAEAMLAQLKSSADMMAAAEQECQANQLDAQVQLKAEQAKMDDLQDQLTKLDRILASYK